MVGGGRGGGGGKSLKEELHKKEQIGSYYRERESFQLQRDIFSLLSHYWLALALYFTRLFSPLPNNVDTPFWFFRSKVEFISITHNDTKMVKNKQ